MKSHDFENSVPENTPAQDESSPSFAAENQMEEDQQEFGDFPFGYVSAAPYDFYLEMDSGIPQYYRMINKGDELYVLGEKIRIVGMVGVGMPLREITLHVEPIE